MSVLRQRTSQRSKKLWIAGGIGAVATGILSVGIFLFSYHELKQAEAKTAANYEKIIQNDKNTITAEQQSKHKVYVVTHDLDAGTLVTVNDLTEVDIPKGAVPDNVVDDAKYPIGKYTKIAIRKNTPLVQTMFYEEGVTPADERYQEFNVLKLPSDLKANQYVDVRIKFADGQDFIVLSKKKVCKLDGNNIFFQMDEKEIETMASAIIDGYLNKATLYAVTYVDPTVQTASVVDYPVRNEVQSLIMSDPNILVEAKQSLADRLRMTLDANLKAMSPNDQAQAAAATMPEGAPIGQENPQPPSQQNSQPDGVPSGTVQAKTQGATSPVANGGGSSSVGSTAAGQPNSGNSGSGSTTDSSKSLQKSIFQTNVNNAVSP